MFRNITILNLIIFIMAGCAIPYKPTYRTFSRRTFNQIETEPDRYKSQIYAFRGRVIQAHESSDTGLLFQMCIEEYPRAYGGPFLTVLYKAYHPTSIAKDYTVEVLGYIGNTITGQNAFGATVTSLTLNAIAITVDNPYDGLGTHVYWLKEHDDTVQKWQSGELFSQESDAR